MGHPAILRVSLLRSRGEAWREGVRSRATTRDTPHSTPADKERPLGTPACHAMKPRGEDGPPGVEGTGVRWRRG
jgi:hypothetical protein